MSKVSRPEVQTGDDGGTSAADLERRIAEATLPEDFVLTDFTRLKGCSCKIPQDHLLALLRTAARLRPGTADVGMDCSIVDVKSPGIAKLANGQRVFLVSTTDFFFPSVRDPYLQGEIGAANVLSDMYAMGIVDIDNVLMLIAASTDMDETESNAVTREMMRGFINKCREGETEVTGGQSVRNPWPLIGGVAMSTVLETEMLRPTGMRAGDVMVLTKPLGTQVAVSLGQWARRPSQLYSKLLQRSMTTEEMEAVYGDATRSMAFLNRDAARLMKTFGAHAATDVTGFGLLGHARNLAAAQSESVRIVIDTLPILEGAVKAERLLNNKYKLFAGLSAETSGGLLIAFPTPEAAASFVQALAEKNQQSWIVGRAVPRVADDPVTAVVLDNHTVLPVAHFP